MTRPPAAAPDSARFDESPASRPEEAAPTSDDARSRVVARPDGFYWVADDGHQEFGPFASALEAQAALRGGIETGLEPDQTLQQAEDEIGYVPPRLDDRGLPEE